MKTTKLMVLMGLCGFLCGLGGCMDITGRGPAPLARTIDAASEQTPRVGHVYCMRGWLGIFSTGMDALAVKIDKEVGTPAVSVADEEWRRLEGWIIAERKEGALGKEPLVLLGHSYGADDQIRVAQDLQAAGIGVDLLVLIDPVTPPPVPTNVKRVYCVFMSHPLTDWYPAWRGVSATVVNPKVTMLTNIDLRLNPMGIDTSAIDHANIEKSAGVHKLVMEQIRETCPLRSVWAAEHGSSTNVSEAPAARVAAP